MNTADKVIQIAMSQVGYMEKSAAAYKKDPSILYKFTEGAGSDNYTKYGKEMHDIYPSVMDFPAPYCDAFVDWCFYQAYGVANAKGLLGGNFDDYTPNSAGLYKKKNAYYKKPEVGDQIFFNNGKRICHTGIVYKVDDTTVYTIEGNTSNGTSLVANGGMVCKKSYSLKYSKIDGYGRPKYDRTNDGFQIINGVTYFYEAGAKVVKRWIKRDGFWYRFGNSGEMLTGWHLIYDSNGKLRECFFDEEGRLYHEADDRQGYLEVWKCP